MAKFQIYRKRSVFGYYVEDMEPDFECDFSAVVMNNRNLVVTDTEGRQHTFRIDTFNYNYYTISGMKGKSKFV